MTLSLGSAAPVARARSRNDEDDLAKFRRARAESRRTWRAEHVAERVDEAALLHARFDDEIDGAFYAQPSSARALAVSEPLLEEESFAPTRRRWVKALGFLLLACAYAALVWIATTGPGSAAIASWLTMGHGNDVRSAVQRW